MKETQPITLRNFRAEDCDFLAAHYAPGMTADDAMTLIGEWNQKSFQGMYFEMFAVVFDGAPVGWISLYAHDAHTISAGMEIIESERRKGFGSAALAQALVYAAQLGYYTAVAQVRKNNAASLRLHEACGFAVTGECVTSKGGDAFWLRKPLGGANGTMTLSNS